MSERLVCGIAVSFLLVFVPALSAIAQDDSIKRLLTAQAGQGESMPGQWSATSPLGTTQIHFKLNDAPRTNADGSRVFTGKMWTTGSVVVIPGDLEAILNGEKLSLKYPDGSGLLTANGKGFVGSISFSGGRAVLQNLEFRKQ